MLKYFSKKKAKEEPPKEGLSQEATNGEAAHQQHTTPASQASTTVNEPNSAPEIQTIFGDSQQQRPDQGRRSNEDEPPISPVLDKDDEQWLRSILDDDNGPPPPLPVRPSTLALDISDSDVGSEAHGSDDDKAKDKDEKKKAKKAKKEKEKEKEKKDKDKDEKHPHRFSTLFSRKKHHGDTLKPEDVPPQDEEEREKKDLNRVLDRLNIGAKNNKLMSSDSQQLLKSFTNIFKDLANGVPTACNDLVTLFDDSEGTINKGFEKLPSSLQKLVTQLPEKLTSSIAPELLAVAAESQGLKADAEGNLKDAAMKLLTPKNLTELVTKPGAMVSMLQAIVNALKVRWPAFIGTNAIVSVALFILMFVLWYCHKRGREVRLEKEASTDTIDGKDRIEELPDDPMLLAPTDASRSHPAATTRVQSTEASTTHPAAMTTKVPEALPAAPADEPVSPLSVEMTSPFEREAPLPVSR